MINPAVEFYWLPNIRQFIDRYQGYPMLYWNQILGEWVSWWYASQDAENITKAKQVTWL